MMIARAWAWILNITVICFVSYVATKIVLEILETITDWILRDRTEDFPGYKETGLSRKTWNRQPLEYKEKVWREIKEKEKTI